MTNDKPPVAPVEGRTTMQYFDKPLTLSANDYTIMPTKLAEALTALVRELRKAMENNLAKPTDPATYKTAAPEVKWPSEMMREMMHFGLLRTNPIFRHDVV
jgi:hypothetical protein